MRVEPEALLSAAEAERFREEGFLMIPEALSAADLTALHAALERFEAEVPPNRTSSYYNYADILHLDPAFLGLIDTPRVFPKVFGLLGFNIWVNHSHINEDLPDPEDVGYSWHRDGAMASWDLECRPIPLLGIKVGFFLTDVADPRSGTTHVLPGTHRKPDTPLPAHGTIPDDAVALCGGPGTAVLFDPRLIHCRGPNHGSEPRKAVFLQYAFRWLKPLDAMTVPASLTAETDPVRRQLLGLDVGETRARRSGNWYPAAGDVPLRGFLIEALGDEVERWVGALTAMPPGWSRDPMPKRPSEY